jgi:hypothetical protein
VAANGASHPRSERSSSRSTLVEALLVVLARPEIAAVSLAGFLVRGGLLVVLFPIVVLPTPAGLANVFAPAIVQLYFGHISGDVVALVGGSIAALLAWLVIANLVGARLDVALARDAALDDDGASATGTIPWRDTSPPISEWGVTWRAFAVRLTAHLPLAIVLAWGAFRIYEATYAELTSPFEVVTPLVVRILNDVPDAIAALVISWILGEAAGGLGVRYLVLGPRSAIGALWRGWFHLIRDPLASLTTLVVTDVVLAGILAFSFAAAGAAWTLVEETAFDGGDATLTVAAALALAAAWLAGLVAIGLATCWRSVSWTLEWVRVAARHERRRARTSVAGVGTIGGDDGDRPGDWSSPDRSGTV